MKHFDSQKASREFQAYRIANCRIFKLDRWFKVSKDGVELPNNFANAANAHKFAEAIATR